MNVEKYPIWLKLTGCVLLAFGGLVVWQLPGWLDIEDSALRLGIVGAGGAIIGSSLAALIVILRARRGQR